MTRKTRLSLIWDIDGTLLSNSSLPMRQYVQEAIATVWDVQVSAEQLDLHGLPDLQIVSQALGRSPSQVLARMAVFEAVLSEKAGLDIQSLAAERRVLPGITDCLTGVDAHHTVASGAGATRSLRKLRAHDLEQYFCWTCASFGDLVDSRGALVAAAIENAQCHGEMQHVVIGDTPQDVRAARINGLPAVAVASGAFDPQVLTQEDPDLVLVSADVAALTLFLDEVAQTGPA